MRNLEDRLGELLKQAETLLAEGQHGPCDAAWKQDVRDYFSRSERGGVLAEIAAELARDNILKIRGRYEE
jgi:hypothetical protein